MSGTAETWSSVCFLQWKIGNLGLCVALPEPNRLHRQLGRFHFYLLRGVGRVPLILGPPALGRAEWQCHIFGSVLILTLSSLSLGSILWCGLCLGLGLVLKLSLV